MWQMQIPFILFVGKDELDSEQYKLKDLMREKEHTLGFERLVSTLLGERKHSELDTL
jgi:histidyl-tRNA synthetase